MSRGGVTLSVVLMLLSIGCAGPAVAPMDSAQDRCVTSVDAFSPYSDADCHRCENVTAAEGTLAPRCGEKEDRDGDGIANQRDACPDTDPVDLVLANGCAQMELEGVTFRVGSARLKQDARHALDRQVSYLRKASFLRVRIEGHTDGQGSAGYNLDLSLRRARAVRTYFADHGIDPERLEVEGYGENRPVASNDTEEGRARNRRVEMRVIDDVPIAR